MLGKEEGDGDGFREGKHDGVLLFSFFTQGLRYIPLPALVPCYGIG